MNLFEHLDLSNEWDRRTAAIYLAAQRRHDGRIQLVSKRNSLLIKVLAWLLIKVTFGRGLDLVDQAFTTIGHCIYIPGDGSILGLMDPISRCKLISHEVAHIDDFFLGDPNARIWTQEECDGLSQFAKFYLAWIRYPLLGLGYLFAPLPFRYAYVRQRVEHDGFLRNVEIDVVNGEGDISLRRRQGYETYFRDASYAWMSTEKRARELVSSMVRIAKQKYREGKLDHFKGSADPLADLDGSVLKYVDVDSLKHSLVAAREAAVGTAQRSRPAALE